jgi:hypothetical protein
VRVDRVMFGSGSRSGSLCSACVFGVHVNNEEGDRFDEESVKDGDVD